MSKFPQLLVLLGAQSTWDQFPENPPPQLSMSTSATRSWLKPAERPEIIDTLISGVGESRQFLSIDAGTDLPEK
jgi:hypothetical protein